MSVNIFDYLIFSPLNTGMLLYENYAVGNFDFQSLSQFPLYQRSNLTSIKKQIPWQKKRTTPRFCTQAVLTFLLTLLIGFLASVRHIRRTIFTCVRDVSRTIIGKLSAIGRTIFKKTVIGVIIRTSIGTIL